MAARSLSNSILVTTGLALVLCSASGCGFFRRLAGKDTVDLKKAQVASMSVGLRRAQKTICPREPVQMAVFAKVTLEGDKEAKDIETWQGKHGANRNDKMEFADFAFRSEQGNFDQDGWFAGKPQRPRDGGQGVRNQERLPPAPRQVLLQHDLQAGLLVHQPGGQGGRLRRARRLRAERRAGQGRE